ALMIWVGAEALDPAWTAQVTRGQYLVDAPNWVRSPVILATAAVVLLTGLWMLWAGLTRAAVVTADSRAISARTIVGRQRRLVWADIVDAKRRKNQLVLSPPGVDTISQEIWDRKSVFLDGGMLDAAKGEIEALVQRHRPDLLFRDVK
ncbi:MAG: hypothetical protein ACREEP_01465, partial [Dongiaceae bacterium]